MTQLGWLRKISGVQARGGNHDRRNTPTQRSAKTPPCLEQLEDRLTPTTFDTAINLFIWTNPNNSERGVERLTAVVSQAGVQAPVTSGNVVFSINNHPVGTAPLNSAGYAQIDVPEPLLAMVGTQTVQTAYQGATVGADTFNSSVFSTPVFLNIWNALFTSSISFQDPPSNQSAQPANPNSSENFENDAILFFNAPFLPDGNPFAIVQYDGPGAITLMTSF